MPTANPAVTRDRPTGDRHVVVTGASSGIGRAVARRFRDAGWDVTATARRDADLAALETEGYRAVRLELADAASVEAAAKAILEAGAPDVLVNNAGFGLVAPVAETTRETWDALLAANVAGPFDLARHLLPAMRDAGGGRVITLGSPAGREGIPFMGAYAAAKSAAALASDALRVEARAWNVRVSVVEPGPTRSRFAEKALGHVGDADQRAQSAYAHVYKRLTRFEHAFHRGLSAERVAAVVYRTATQRWPPARVPVGGVAWLTTLKGLLPGTFRRGLYALALGLTRRG